LWGVVFWGKKSESKAGVGGGSKRCPQITEKKTKREVKLLVSAVQTSQEKKKKITYSSPVKWEGYLSSKTGTLPSLGSAMGGRKHAKGRDERERHYLHKGTNKKLKKKTEASMGVTTKLTKGGGAGERKQLPGIWTKGKRRFRNLHSQG